jgi:hypothetical protein
MTPNYKQITISLETVFGQDPEMDRMFTEYLDEYSITYQNLGSDPESASTFPILEYSGGPVSLSNMLREKFGFTPEEILVAFPELDI